MIRTACKLLFISLSIYCSFALAGVEKSPSDPFEPLNREIFQFNYHLDRLVYRPIAKLYLKTVHSSIQKAINNILNNIDEVPSIANDLLQADGQRLVINTWRLIINTTVGLLGTIDVASGWGLPACKNDFGLTLYKWGFRESPYIQIVLLGPSTLRDGVGIGVDYALRPTSYWVKTPVYYGAGILKGISTRAQLLAANKLIDEAIDPYLFVRDAYLQKRAEDIRKMKKTPENP